MGHSYTQRFTYNLFKKITSLRILTSIFILFCLGNLLLFEMFKNYYKIKKKKHLLKTVT